MKPDESSSRDGVCRHPLATRPIQYTDSLGGVQTCRDDLWAVTTAELNAIVSEQQPITDNDRRWRFLEHGCQWVSFIPLNGEQRSFDPRILSGYAGHLQDMRATVDAESTKHIKMLKDAIEQSRPAERKET